MQVCEGACRTHVSIGDVCRAQGSEYVVVRMQVNKGAAGTRCTRECDCQGMRNGRLRVQSRFFGSEKVSLFIHGAVDFA